MKTQQITQTTHTEHIQELRDSAVEAQAARLEVVTEIARLTKALRRAEAERDAARTELAEATVMRTDRISCHHCLMVFSFDDPTARDHWRECLYHPARKELDAARADAERLAKVMNTIAYEPIGDSEASFRTVYEDITEMARAALTAHRAATGKAVTK